MSSPGEKLSRRRFMARLSAIAATLAVAGVARDSFADECAGPTHTCPGPNTCTPSNVCGINICLSDNSCSPINQCTTSNRCANGNQGNCGLKGNSCDGINTCYGGNTCSADNRCNGTTHLCDVNTCNPFLDECNRDACTTDDSCSINTCTIDTDCGLSDISCYPIGHKCTKVDNAAE